ncbi:MAG: nickel pincer cofactor biosynthesis protein LarC [Candidatus Krumholzibacteria bacterium]|nr:nickel pincer cofactor biosynthesis protein LarC [Candidatus Krumholzibacteria bacterium]
MKKALVVDPFSGASGDMFLGALVSVGAPFDLLKRTLLAVPALEKVSVKQHMVSRGVFAATRIEITCPPERAHRSLSVILEIIDEADLKDQVKAGAAKTFTLLARAEAKVHGCDVEEIHFHEVGALDAIADIIGVHVAVDLLDNPAGLVRPIALGSGTTQTEHGEIPVPSPATLELLSGYEVQFSDIAEELVTPTGAALISSLCRPLDPASLITAGAVGYGAGGRDRDGLPNVLRVILGKTDEGKGRVCIITSTVDDMSPEVYGYLMDQLFAQGALEVYYCPVMMKKSRPGVEVTLITEEHNAYRLADFLMSNTTTLGVRVSREERIELSRRKVAVETDFGTIEIKIGERPDGTELVSPEYESCREAAVRSNARLLDVYEAARRAWHEKRQK